DLAAVVDAVERAAAASAGIAAALADVAGALRPAGPEGEGPRGRTGERRSQVTDRRAGPDAARPDAAGPDGGDDRADAGGDGAGARRGPRIERRPPPLPPGVFDDSVEAADALLRRADAVVLVDGYNVAMTVWPDLPKSEQRRRLERSLDELAARCRCRPEVVWDGAAVVEPLPVTSPRGVRVRFSPADVEADDVILDRLGELPPSDEVVVVSSDREVRDGARAGGAGVLSSEQLRDALRLG
ncbi:MAG TPA: NYN domain-containing protein, partial [Acidimicrobiales bacterium]|nr:NYN domain-containing protein [Acidimicrobiales bacterium]